MRRVTKGAEGRKRYKSDLPGTLPCQAELIRILQL